MAPQARPIFERTVFTYEDGKGINAEGLRILESLLTCTNASEKGITPCSAYAHTTKYVLTCSTTILWALTSSARALVNVVRNAFVPEYVASIGDGIAPAKEPMFKIRPRFLD